MAETQPVVEVTLQIPELLDLIATNLAPPDLLSCVQVSRQWNARFIPQLWRTIDDSILSWPHILSLHDALPPPPQQGSDSISSAADENNNGDNVSSSDNEGRDTAWILAVFKKHAHHIRHLTVSWRIVLDAIGLAGTCTQLLSFRFQCRTGKFSGQLTLRERHDLDKRMATARSPNDNGADIYNQNAHNLPIYARQREPASASRFISKIFEPRNVDEDGKRINVLVPAQVNWRTLAQQHDDWVTFQHLWILIRTNPRLRRLKLASDGNPEAIGRVASEDFICESLGLLKNLESLSATFLDPEDYEEAIATANKNAATTVQRIALANPGVLRKYFTTISRRRTFEIHSTITSLQYLELRGALRCREFFLILKHLPKLQSFEIESFHRAENPADPEYYDFAKSLLENEPPSCLSNLMFSGFFRVRTVGNNDEMAKLVLPWIRHLRGIRIHFMSNKSLCHLIKYCPELERYAERSSPMTIHPRQGPHREVDEISTVLEGFPNLKMLNSIKERLSVNKVLSFPWACSRLEVLRIQFVGFDRLTPEEQHVFDSIPRVSTSTAEEHVGQEVQQHQSLDEEQQQILEKHRRCREQHHNMYDRLATLTQLKVLNTGYEYRDVWDVERTPSSLYKGADGQTYYRYSGPIANTMEWSLESGLDRLVTLMNLEVFGFEGSDHRIGKAELDWMAASWPRLKTVTGLQIDKLPKIEYDLKKAELREYMQRLRPGIKHTRLHIPFL